MFVRGLTGRLTVGPRAAATFASWELSVSDREIGARSGVFTGRVAESNALLLMQRPIVLRLQLDRGVFWTWAIDRFTVDGSTLRCVVCDPPTIDTW